MYQALCQMLVNQMVSQKDKDSTFRACHQCRGGSVTAQIIWPMIVNYTEIKVMGEWTWCHAYM